MGIIETIAKTAVKSSLQSRAKRSLIGPLQTAQDLAEKATEKAAQKFEEYKQTICSKNPSNLHLWMDTDNKHKSRVIAGGYKHKQTYTFYDEEGNQKYVANSRYDNRRQRIELFDMSNKKLGKITEKLIALRGPLSTGANPADFQIEINGKTLGKVSSQIKLKDPRLDVKFNGWHVSRRKHEGAYPITDKNGAIITEVTPSLLYPTFIDIFRPEDEILIVLLILTSNAYSESVDRKQ